MKLNPAPMIMVGYSGGGGTLPVLARGHPHFREFFTPQLMRKYNQVKVMIYLVHPDEVEKTVEMFTKPISKHMDDMRNSYMYRVVSSYNELKENY